MKVREASIFHSNSLVKLFFVLCLVLIAQAVRASFILVPMDEKQSNHLKAYGITY